MSRHLVFDNVSWQHEVRLAGYKSYFSGINRNPWKDGTPESAIWQAGWNEAHHDDDQVKGAKQ